MHVDHTRIPHKLIHTVDTTISSHATNGAIAIAETTSVRLYVTVIINSVVTNDIDQISDNVNIITEAAVTPRT